MGDAEPRPGPQRRGRCRVNAPPELALGPGSPAPGARSRRRGPSWTRRGFRVPFPPRRRVRRRLSANPRATGSAVGPRTRVLRAAAAPPPLPPASGLPASPSGNPGRGDAVPRLGLGVPDPRPGRGRAVSPRVPVPPRGPRFVCFVAGCEVPAAAPGAGALSRHHVPGRQAPRTSWFLCCCWLLRFPGSHCPPTSPHPPPSIGRWMRCVWDLHVLTLSLQTGFLGSSADLADSAPEPGSLCPVQGGVCPRLWAEPL